MVTQLDGAFSITETNITFFHPDLFLSVPIKQIFTNDDVDTMQWVQSLGGKKNGYYQNPVHEQGRYPIAHPIFWWTNIQGRIRKRPGDRH